MYHSSQKNGTWVSKYTIKIVTQAYTIDKNQMRLDGEEDE